MPNGRKPICDLQFASDIDLKAGSNSELQDLTNSLIDKAAAYGKEVCTEKGKTMIYSMNNLNADIA